MLSGEIPPVTHEELTPGEYTYTINNLQGNHTLFFNFGRTVVTSGIYIKLNGIWREAGTAYQKVSGTWVQVTASTVDRTKKYKLN